MPTSVTHANSPSLPSFRCRFCRNNHGVADVHSRLANKRPALQELLDTDLDNHIRCRSRDRKLSHSNLRLVASSSFCLPQKTKKRREWKRAIALCVYDGLSVL